MELFDASNGMVEIHSTTQALPDFERFLARLSRHLSTLPSAARWWVGYSGGVDSHLLLYALTLLQQRAMLPTMQLRPVHIDHALQPQSSQWAEHCQAVCERLGRPLTSLQVDARPLSGESREAAARRARYAALRSLLQPDDLLLTAHHRDDQAETLLLQLFRGAGPAGLAAMPALAPFPPGWIARPLLEFDRREIEQQARQRALHWIEDPSNRDPAFDRNYLRHQIMPPLTERWPALNRTVARAARLQGETRELLEQIADEDIERIESGAALAVSALRLLSGARRRNLLRRWIQRRQLPPPGERHLQQLEQMLTAAEDRMPLVSWSGVEVRRYRDRLYAAPPLLPHDPAAIIEWPDPTQPLTLTPLDLTLQISAASTFELFGLRDSVQIRFRTGGERCRLPGQRERLVKQLLQEAAIPPWQRARIPLLFIEGELAAVGDLWSCGRWAAQGVRLILSAADPDHSRELSECGRSS